MILQNQLFQRTGEKQIQLLVLIASQNFLTSSRAQNILASNYKVRFFQQLHNLKAVLLSLWDRGVKAAKLAVGDGGLGLCSALAEVYPETRAQRCWVHKTANVLDRLPKGVQGEAKSMLHEMWGSATRAHAQEAFERFLATWEAKYPKAA